MKGFRDRADVEDVRRLVADSVRVGPAEAVPVTDCAGRVLASDIVAPVDVPGFDRAAMDGYAVLAEETFGASRDNPLGFRLVGESRPGRPFGGSLGGGETVRIMTGAAVPAGADAVVMAESTHEDHGVVQVIEAVPPGKNVGARGEDVTRGTIVLSIGRRLRAQDAALLASIGISPVPVVSRPRVDLVITGDELLPPGSVPSGTAIVDSNSIMLTALVGRDGGVIRTLVQVPDTAEAVRAALLAAGAEIVLVSGGSSVGLEDHAPRVLAEIGELAVHGIAMRPSSPTGLGFLRADAGRHQRRLVFLLPGNPVSCLCAYDFFAGPAIRVLGGAPYDWPHRQVTLPLTRKIVSAIGRVDYVRVRVRDGKVEPLAVSGAGILSSTVRADGFVIVERDKEGVGAGEAARVLLYD